MSFDYDGALDGAMRLWEELSGKPLQAKGSSYAVQLRAEEFFDLARAIRSAQLARGKQEKPVGRIPLAWGAADPLLTRERGERAGFDPRRMVKATEGLLDVLDGRGDAASLRALRKVMAVQALCQAAIDYDEKNDAEADEIPPPTIIICGQLPTETAEEAVENRRAETLAAREWEKLQAEKFLELTRLHGEDVTAARDAFTRWAEGLAERGERQVDRATKPEGGSPEPV